VRSTRPRNTGYGPGNVRNGDIEIGDVKSGVREAENTVSDARPTDGSAGAEES